MRRCKKCSKQLQSTDRFCPNCGEPVNPSGGQSQKHTAHGKLIALTVGSLCVLLALGFAAKWYAGEKTRQVIEQEIADILREADDPVHLTYGKLSVKPLSGEAIFQDVKLTRPSDTLEFDRIRATLDYAQMLKLVIAGEIEQLTDLKIQLDGIHLQAETREGPTSLKFEDGHMELKGPFSKQVFSDPDRLLEADHGGTVVLSGGTLTIPFLRYLPVESDILARLTEIEELSFQYGHDSSERTFTVNAAHLETPLLTLSTSGSWKYIGNTLETMRFVKYSGGQETTLAVKDLAWGLATETGRYSLGGLTVRGKFDADTLNRNQQSIPLPEGQLAFSLQDLSAEFAGPLRQRIEQELWYAFGKAIECRNLTVDQLDINCRYTDKTLEVFDTKLLSPLFNASLDASVAIDEGYVANSDLIEFTFCLSDLREDVQAVVHRFERYSGRLPREDGDIVLRLTGKLGNPQLL